MRSLKTVVGLLLVALFLVSCNKYEETIKYPKEVKMMIGQKCLICLIKDETDYITNSSNLYVNNYSTFVWNISDSTILRYSESSIVAQKEGECEISTVYSDKNGTHTASCLVKVTNIDISSDTIFAYDGDTVVIFDCNAPSGYSINYQFEYENTNHFDVGQILKSNNQWISEGGCVSLSPISRYFLPKTISDDIIGVHILCEPLNIDLRIPIVVMESDESLNY